MKTWDFVLNNLENVMGYLRGMYRKFFLNLSMVDFYQTEPQSTEKLIQKIFC